MRWETIFHAADTRKLTNGQIIYPCAGDTMCYSATDSWHHITCVRVHGMCGEYFVALLQGKNFSAEIRVFYSTATLSGRWRVRDFATPARPFSGERQRSFPLHIRIYSQTCDR